LFDEKKKNKKKNEETQPIFEGSYLGKTLCGLVEIWMTLAGISTTKFIWFRWSVTELRIRDIAFILSIELIERQSYKQYNYHYY